MAVVFHNPYRFVAVKVYNFPRDCQRLLKPENTKKTEKNEKSETPTQGRVPKIQIKHRKIVVSPISRNSPWNICGCEKVKLERNADKFGREFWAWIFGGGLKPWKNQVNKLCGKNSPSKFAEKFAGKFPKIRQAKIKNSPQIRAAEPRAQKIWNGLFLSYFWGPRRGGKYCIWAKTGRFGNFSCCAC